MLCSEKRHLARYYRRKEKREAKRKAFIKEYDNIEKVVSLSALDKSAHQSVKGLMFKPSHQRYMINEYKNICSTRRRAYADEDLRRGFICFTLCERGHLRHIKSVHIDERVPQKSLTQNVLIPVYSHNLIYSNGACLKGKGTKFSIELCKKDLREFYVENGFTNDGFALLFDIHGYFDNIQHAPILSQFSYDFTDKHLIKMHKDFIDAFGDVGLGLGSEVCQIHAVAYMNPVDHYIKDTLGVKHYTRYMDDGYLFFKTKEEAQRALYGIRAVVERLGLELSEKKTMIVKISHGFKFLKNRMVLTSTGKVLTLPWKRSIVKHRQKLKKLVELVAKGILTVKEVLNTHYSWLGYMWYKTSFRVRRRMNHLIYNLMPEIGKGVFKWIPKSVLRRRKSLRLNRERTIMRTV